MPTLTLTEVWLNLVSTGEAVHAPSDPQRDREYNDVGEMRTYGEGRRRSVSQAGERGSRGFVLLGVNETQLDTLRAWKKQLVQYRDNYGQRHYGTYYAVNIGEPATYRDVKGYTAGITIAFATHTEGEGA